MTLTLELQPERLVSDKVSSQKAALRELWHELDQLPQARNDDGWSVRQYDELLYGDYK